MGFDRDQNRLRKRGAEVRFATRLIDLITIRLRHYSFISTVLQP
jgi:hypothetical protein